MALAAHESQELDIWGKMMFIKYLAEAVGIRLSDTANFKHSEEDGGVEDPLSCESRRDCCSDH